MGATTAYLAWIPRTRPDRSLRQDRSADVSDRALRPISHVTRQAHLGKRVGAGDTIWLAGNHPRFGLGQPSLDGRILVSEVRRRNGGWEFVAAKQSRWLEWNDAGELLCSLDLVGVDGSVGRLNSGRPIGPQLQTTRRLSSEAASRLDARARALAARPRLFISYRWRVRPKTMGRLVAAAAAAGFAPWWDRWSAPRGLATGQDEGEGAVATETELARMMSDGIAASAAALIVRTPDYASAGWTRFEWDQIVARDLPRAQVAADAVDREALDRALATLRAALVGSAAIVNAPLD